MCRTEVLQTLKRRFIHTSSMLTTLVIHRTMTTVLIYRNDANRERIYLDEAYAKQ